MAKPKRTRLDGPINTPLIQAYKRLHDRLQSEVSVTTDFNDRNALAKAMKAIESAIDVERLICGPYGRFDAIDAGRKSGKLEERGPYPNDWVMARRVSEDEYLIMEKLEYVDGRIMTGPGIELFVGVKEFPAYEVKKARRRRSSAMAAIRQSAKALYRAGAINKRTMKGFGAK